MSIESTKNAFMRFVREKVTGTIFVYDPNFHDAQTPWKKLDDGRIIVGPEQVRSALKSAEVLGTPDAATVIGLSKTYIEKHFPEALKINP